MKDINVEKFEQQILEAAQKELVQEESLTEDVEVTSNDTTSEVQRQYTELELEQMEKGWDPNKEDGVSAKEFKRVGEIIEAKRRASKEAQVKSKEVEELTQTVKQLVEHNKALAKAQEEKAKRELALKKMEKIQEGDVDGVLAIEQQQEELERASKPVQAPAVAPESEAVTAFKQKYADALTGTRPEDKRIQAMVEAQVKYYLANDPNIDEKVAIAEIEDLLGKAFPDRFETNTPKTPKASKVGQSTASRSSGTSELVGNMSLDDRALYQSIRAVDPTFTVDQFATMYLKTRK